MEDKLQILIEKVSKLEKSIDAMMKTMESHRAEHGFSKMQDGGVNAQYGQPGMGQPGMGGPNGGGMQQGMGGGMPGMGGGYQMPGMGGGGPDPSRPPGM